VQPEAPPSNKYVHVYKNESWVIMTKQLFFDPYITFVRVNDDMASFTFTDFQRVNRLRVKFTYGDGSPVDFNGHNHNFTLIFGTVQADVDELCV
jgi:hypothetical protein